MPNFEVYKRADSYGRRSRHEATVTVQRRGCFSFSPAAIAMIGNPGRVKLLYDRDEQLVGFRGAKRSDTSAHAIRSHGNGQHILSAAAFCQFAEIDTSESRRYPLVEIEGTACIDLKQPGTPVTSNRRKTGAR
jgi:hypothetical protein